MGDGDYYLIKENAVASLIHEDIIFIGGKFGLFFDPEDPDDGQVALWINCNDLWCWGMADGEPLEMRDIEGLYIASCEPCMFSVVKWVCKRFKRRPMPEIISDMKAVGEWDDEMEALPKQDDI